VCVCVGGYVCVYVSSVTIVFSLSLTQHKV